MTSARGLFMPRSAVGYVSCLRGKTGTSKDRQVASVRRESGVAGSLNPLLEGTV